MAKDVVVFDCESVRLASEVPGGWNSVHLMGFACGVIYSVSEDGYMVYDASEIEEFKRRLQRADQIVTFNGTFDFTLVWELPSKQVPKEYLSRHCDLYRRVCVASNRNPNLGHKGFGLGALCERTIGRGKIEDGANAPQLFREGKLARLHSYCLSDVKLTRDLWRHIETHGFVVGPKGVHIQVPAWQNTKQLVPASAGLTSGLI